MRDLLPLVLIATICAAVAGTVAGLLIMGLGRLLGWS